MSIDNLPLAVDLTSGYDGRGNLKKYTKSGTAYELAFDAENRLASLKVGTGTPALFEYDAGGQRVRATYPDGTSVYTPFPDYEISDPPGTGANTIRTTYRLAGQMVALRVQDGTTNTLYYPLTDHLGNVAALSDADGNLVSGSVAHYDPFGAFTPAAPTTNPVITNHGFTGHRHNNTGSNDLGLIYMNARYYLPEAGRFISPDSIVPDPGNPQSFNRYVYTLNNPVNYADPSGHCPGTDGNSEDQACWDYLMGRGEANFCANGICGDGDWTQWLVAQKGMYTGTWSFSTPWTKTELEILSSTIGDVIGALESIGVDWHNTPLPQFKYKRAGSSLDGGMTLGRTISLGSVSPYLVLHETGHAIDAGFGKELHDWYDQEVGNCSILFCNPYAAPGSYYREYGHTAFHNKLGSAYGVAARQGETWADAFAAWVDQPEAQLQAEINLAIDWQGISDAVVSSLEHRFR